MVGQRGARRTEMTASRSTVRTRTDTRVFPRRRRLRTAAALLLLLPVAGPATADVCRWRDASGKTHYSATPPPGISCSRTLHTAPSTPSGGNAASPGPRSYRELESEFQQRRIRRYEAERKAESERKEAARRAEACKAARGRLAWMESGGLMARIDANGERRFFSDEEARREMAAQRRRVDRYCR